MSLEIYVNNYFLVSITKLTKHLASEHEKKKITMRQVINLFK